MEMNQKYMVDEKNGHEYVNKNYNIQSLFRPISAIEKLIIHCTAADVEKWNDPIYLINYDMGPNHISRKGCPTATYHFYINKLGEVFQLVSMGIKTWHCTDQNYSSIAICIHHGGTTKNVTPEQYKSLIECIKYVFDFMEWEITERSLRYRLYFHRNFANKFCPGYVDYDKLITDLL